ncbi:DUF4129 domain-containing protein [Dactylosporangium matsuzakiense]|uniref:Protein-glutamine gamma-glutamyltransferase-like C-terminal domain-containing protein n=1 Tax=Dactylosporangium matsuzakiense TaxID=53360 RepID=A0A9W6KUD4_9ACTN|nr:DUF4129 domain-containing protein [Dactylosporangium matsuzakiense]UWZ44111.1 DUF4129 domain-containing protein [Dactylosporangium matsuzakiense]GLL07402.1 hypothetical protein GCM10017581_091540 [Dactylosporangium matsuzakiense]
MTRAWAELLQLVDDLLGVPLAAVLLLLAAILFGVLYYFYPRWVPKRFPRLRFRRQGKGDQDQLDVDPDEDEEPEPDAEPSTDEEVPELPAHVFASLADRLAAEGRYAEAVRERLRSMVRGLVEREILEHRPGMTVTELARAAGAARPAVEAPMRNASGIFSDIWYGERPATAEHDSRMREFAAEVNR